MEYQKLKPIIFYMQKYRTVICIIFSIVFALTGTWKIVQAREGKLTQEMIRLQKDLAKEVFRFHILANSDVEEDQELKMQVKEAVILYMKEMLPAGADRQETKQWVIRHQDEIEEIAECVIEEQGYSYSVRTELVVYAVSVLMFYRCSECSGGGRWKRKTEGYINGRRI